MPSCKTRFRHLILPVMLILLSDSVSVRATFFAHPPAENYSFVACVEEELKALLEVSRIFGDLPEVLLWKGEACCNWIGVGCSNTSHVVHLDLSNICVEGSGDRALDAPMKACSGGELSPSFLNLTHLDYLDLSGNSFKNISIPSFLGSLEQLGHLDLSNSGFVGSFPPQLGNLLQLRTLELSRNSISGSLPASIGNLSQLKALDLTGNLISGSLPASIGNLINLGSLHLSQNNISGPLPVSLGNLSRLNSLDLSFNKINGAIPNSIGQLGELDYLDLWSNLWEGVIGESHFVNLTRLDMIQLSSNSKSLVLNFSQEWVPPFNASFIIIQDCRFATPAFPSWLRNQSNLDIVLSNVGISDTIPEWFWRISFTNLDLSNNQLRGKLPNLDQMRVYYVNLENNFLEGSIPVWPYVSTLILSSNRFSGPIPLNIGQEMPSLTTLDLSRNNLSGSIPVSLTRIKGLAYIDLSRNFLSGSIPQNWTSSSSGMTTIDLSDNYLSGQIPPILCYQKSPLLWLRLSNNNLSGEIRLRNCSGLYTLDLGGNQFSGGIPQWIGEDLQSLSYLVLGGNNFTGSIPQQLCSLSFLHVLDLSHNVLSGSLPTCLGNLTQLTNMESQLQLYPPRTNTPFRDIWHIDLHPKGVEYEYTSILPLVNIIDLSSNRLTGVIPEEMRNLTNLGSLNLSHNKLTGNIPEDIGVLQQLQALDLSGNNLEGAIPRSMASMTFLSVLNLSHNNLSGPIPFDNQFHTFNDPALFEGNLGLCGAPLPTQCSSNPDGNPKVEEDEDEDEGSNMWLYVSTVTGFVMGFWAVFGSLVLKKSWRYAYFKFVDDMKERLVVGIITLKLTKQGRQA